MDAHRVTWNMQQHLLQNALSKPEKHPEWRSLFLSQHAQLHSHRMSNGGEGSFEDEVLEGMDDAALRIITFYGIWHAAKT